MSHSIVPNGFALTQVGTLKIVRPATTLKRNMIIKLPKTFLERVRPQTEADSELRPKLQRQAPTCGNALLCTVVQNEIFKSKEDKSFEFYYSS